MKEIRILPIAGVPEVRSGDDVAALLVAAAGADAFQDGDVVVVTQKVVSKAEGRVVDAALRDDAIAAETVRVLRRTPGGMTIAQTRHGFVCANAGIDTSNMPGNEIALLPLDPDLSARRIRARIAHLTDSNVGVVISDTFGRAWRLGQTDIAIGVAGIDPFIDYRGERDANGEPLTATRIAIADELAGAAEMVMLKAEHICAAIVRGAPTTSADGSAVQLVRPAGEDLFR